MDDDAVVVPWSSIYVTLVVAFAQGLIFYAFFCFRRRKDKTKFDQTNDENVLDLYETRQHTRKHRSPPPFEISWWRKALAVDDDELLRCVGLDSYMYLRLLRLGARFCGLGTLISAVLIPIYATGDATGDATEEFNQLTLARVESGSSWRLYIAAFAWWVFVAFILYEFWNEWALFYKNRSDFLARGDLDKEKQYRYAVRVEQVQHNSDNAVYAFFDRLFPGKVKRAESCFAISTLEKLIQERQTNIVKLESAIAATKAKPDKPRPQTRIKCKKVDAMEHYAAEIERLNGEVDELRRTLLQNIGRTVAKQEMMADHTDTGDSSSSPFDEGGNLSAGDQTAASDLTTSTAFVTLTSLRAKQAAIQCQLTGDPDSMLVFPADDPDNMIWENVAVSLPRQKVLQLNMAFFWSVGVLFWAVPVAFVTSISNLNSMLELLNIDEADPDSFWYGLVAGLLPPLALAILMVVLYKGITFAAQKVVCYKSWPEVDRYCVHWHMCYQFANLWLILIGGSLFNQIQPLIDHIQDGEYTEIVDIIAEALPGASVFFVNMIVLSAFCESAMELSLISTYFVSLILGMLIPEAGKTQRQLDEGKKPPSIVWGQQVPPVIFVFLVIFLYMTVVPLLEVFGLIYFVAMYIVWKHQCLHVYAQEFEGGGSATWQQIFGFLMACLYMGEVVFCSYMGIKKAPIQAMLGVVPLVLTIIVHCWTIHRWIDPLRRLSLELAADVDIDDGELSTADDGALYRQPALMEDQDERGPMPYRRDAPSDSEDKWVDGEEVAVCDEPAGTEELAG